MVYINRSGVCEGIALTHTFGVNYILPTWVSFCLFTGQAVESLELQDRQQMIPRFSYIGFNKS